LLEDLVKNRVDSKKPRAEGLTFIIDKFQSIDKESFELLSYFVDTVKIYGALPLLVPEMVLKKELNFIMISTYRYQLAAQLLNTLF
jgi:phosphosulfolactate synthase